MKDYYDDYNWDKKVTLKCVNEECTMEDEEGTVDVSNGHYEIPQEVIPCPKCDMDRIED